MVGELNTKTTCRPLHTISVHFPIFSTQPYPFFFPVFQVHYNRHTQPYQVFSCFHMLCKRLVTKSQPNLYLSRPKKRQTLSVPSRRVETNHPFATTSDSHQTCSTEALNAKLIFQLPFMYTGRTLPPNRNLCPTDFPIFYIRGEYDKFPDFFRMCI